MRIAPSAPGLERVEVFLSGPGFAPHRHDTYGVGFTLRGVQSFRYRGAAERSLAGQVFVLHPDELHDGRAGTDAGLRYRILYVAPHLIRSALGEHHRALPFVRDVVSDDRRLAAAILPALENLDAPLEEMQRDQIVLELTDAMAAAAGSPPAMPRRALHAKAAKITRDFLDAGAMRNVTSQELERLTGLTRFDLARHFRAAFGTSPYRYLILRRLDRAQGMIRRGVALAEAAAACGFADQSHMTRQFKKAYGLSPGRWAGMLAA